MILQDKDIPTIPIGHQIIFAYEGSWKLENIKAQRIFKTPEIEKDKT